MGSNSGTAHKAVSVFLRFWQVACGAIVLGILGAFCQRVRSDDAHVDGRIIYAMVVAGLGTAYALLSFPPLKYQFIAFPADFVLFVMWLVAFSLLCSKTAGSVCGSGWYNNYWGYYWTRSWRFGPVGRVRVRGSACPEWRTVLAFSFIAFVVHILSGILGVYVYYTHINTGERSRDPNRHEKRLSRSTHQGSLGTNEDVETAEARAANNNTE